MVKLGSSVGIVSCARCTILTPKALIPSTPVSVLYIFEVLPSLIWTTSTETGAAPAVHVQY